MNRNMSSTDRIIRLLAGAALAAAAVVIGVTSGGGIALAIAAVVMLGTSAVGFCPLYRVLGVATRR
jgi:hypothetical protein